MTEAIRDRLIELSPEDEAEFTANATQLIEELRQVDSWPCRTDTNYSPLTFTK